MVVVCGHHPPEGQRQLVEGIEQFGTPIAMPCLVAASTTSQLRSAALLESAGRRCRA